jgi:hypothetical protein
LRALVKERASQRLEAYQESLGIVPEESSLATTSSTTEAADDGTPIKTSRSSSLPEEKAYTTIIGDDTAGKPIMMTASSEINLLIEIVSATDLPIADLKSTDPYVVVYLGRQRIHKTQHISSK